MSGGSGAQVVRKGVSTPLKSKAPARAAALPHCASDFNEERDRRIAKASAVRAEPFNGSGTAAEGAISTRRGRTSVVVGRRKVS